MVTLHFLMDIKIRKAELSDLEMLLRWRMTVLHEVFSIPLNKSMETLERENRRYYQNALLKGEHIACFSYVDNTVIGCGGICIYQEMPSPDNPTGKCVYLMNIYTCPEFSKQGAGKEIGFTDMYGYMKL